MMIVNASFYSDSEIDLPQTGSPLMPTSAGHYALKTLTAFDTIRPYGRRDYQILYVHKGCIYYLEDGEQYVAPEGSVLIYPPATPQYYIYYLKDSPDIYWCHFTGKEVRELLDRLGLSGCLCHQNVRSDTYAGLFEQIIAELTNKEMHFKEISSSLLRCLLFSVSRHANASKEASQSFMHPYVREIVQMFHARFNEDFNISEIAKQYGVSASWLIRLFNADLGMSPQKYLTYVRMKTAKTLLNSTKPIAEIAVMLGYGDAFYFSRIFKKEEGMSPSQYRKIRRGTDASKTVLADKFSPLSVLEHTKHESD